MGKRWAQHAVCIGKLRKRYKILAKKPQKERSFGRPRHRRKYHIKVETINFWGAISRVNVSLPSKCPGIVGHQRVWLPEKTSLRTVAVNWLRMGSRGGLLGTRWWTFGFHKCGEYLNQLGDYELLKYILLKVPTDTVTRFTSGPK
jgi:hypothetical protein